MIGLKTNISIIRADRFHFLQGLRTHFIDKLASTTQIDPYDNDSILSEVSEKDEQIINAINRNQAKNVGTKGKFSLPHLRIRVVNYVLYFRKN